VEWDAADLLDEAMGALALKRPIFHTEADFQHALAWEIHLRHPDAGIRLEKRVATRPNIDLDLFVELGGSRLGVELKYPRGRMSAKVGDELFILSTGADDYSRYFAVEDMARLERLVAQQTIDCGALVFLTNVANVWTPPASGRAVLYDEFRLHHGRTVTGTMSWDNSARLVPDSLARLLNRRRSAVPILHHRGRSSDPVTLYHAPVVRERPRRPSPRLLLDMLPECPVGRAERVVFITATA
jgi:hypothetical protein